MSAGSIAWYTVASIKKTHVRDSIECDCLAHLEVKILSCGKDHAREEDDLKSIRKYHLYDSDLF